MPKFSIVVPVYNVEKYITDCLNSLINQTLGDFEVICVDDCGKDKSVEIIKDFIAKDSRIRLVHHESNQGLSEARNSGIKVAKGDYIICVDSDDWVQPELLELVNKAFEDHDVESVWFNARTIVEKTGNWSPLFHPRIFLLKEGWMNITAENFHLFPDVAWNKAFRRDVFEKYNLMYTKGIYFEDAEFHLRAFTNIKRIYYLNTILYNYRLRENSIVTNTKDAGDEKLEDLFRIIELGYDYLISSNKFEQYKKTLLISFNAKMRAMFIKGKREYILNLAKNTLKHINFPEAYSDLKKVN